MLVARRLTGRAVTPAERRLRRRLEGLGASNPPKRRPGELWREWVNRPLRDGVEVERAVSEVTGCGLPVHADAPKNWDLLVALGTILERTGTGASVLEMGAPRYSMLLPWLYLYGYRRLVGIDLAHEGSAQVGPIRYLKMDLTATSFADAAFEAIACLSVIEHGVSFESYLREASRLLKPGGVLVTSTDFWCEPVDTQGQIAYGTPIRIFTRDDMEACAAFAQKCGLRLVRSFEFTCAERVVHWAGHDLDYTFINFVLEKDAANGRSSMRRLLARRG
jgi:SAM-dependent methyltransferase